MNTLIANPFSAEVTEALKYKMEMIAKDYGLEFHNGAGLYDTYIKVSNRIHVALGSHWTAGKPVRPEIRLAAAIGVSMRGNRSRMERSYRILTGDAGKDCTKIRELIAAAYLWEPKIK
jgi:hypothetical protein